MHLSTSSSNDRLPKSGWLVVWLSVGITFISIILLLEYHIRSLGFKPSVVDSMQLWSKQRKRASLFGEKAAILVGSSRIQLDIDMNTISNISGLKPVQLAIDGTSYIPVLENLAKDLSITGTVIVSVNAYNMGRGKPNHKSNKWLSYYDKYKEKKIEPYIMINDVIASYLGNLLVTRLEGAKPAKVISSLVFANTSYGNYLVTHKDRSRDADYSKVKMPDFYANRVYRHCGKDELAKVALTFKSFFEIYKKKISKIKSSDTKLFFTNLNNLLVLVNKIEKRGGKVIFIRFPTDKLLWEFDNKKYPKKIFWNEIKKAHSKSIHFMDYAELSKFSLKDGSHLDFRDKKSFTKALMKLLVKRQFIQEK